MPTFCQLQRRQQKLLYPSSVKKILDSIWNTLPLQKSDTPFSGILLLHPGMFCIKITVFSWCNPETPLFIGWWWLAPYIQFHIGTMSVSSFRYIDTFLIGVWTSATFKELNRSTRLARSSHPYVLDIPRASSNSTLRVSTPEHPVSGTGSLGVASLTRMIWAYSSHE